MGLGGCGAPVWPAAAVDRLQRAGRYWAIPAAVLDQVTLEPIGWLCGVHNNTGEEGQSCS